MTDAYTCDLPGCDVSVTYLPVEDEAWPPEPPPDWFSVLVARNDLQNVDLMYCSSEHMADGLANHLPDAAPAESHESSWTDGLFVAAVLSLTVGVWLLGAVTAVVLLVQAFM
jgi:hypothetical protein